MLTTDGNSHIAREDWVGILLTIRRIKQSPYMHNFFFIVIHFGDSVTAPVSKKSRAVDLCIQESQVLDICI